MISKHSLRYDLINNDGKSILNATHRSVWYLHDIITKTPPTMKVSGSALITRPRFLPELRAAFQASAWAIVKFMKGSLERSPSTPSFALNSWVTAMADPPRSPCKGPLITFYPDTVANLAECFRSPFLFNLHCTNTSTALGHVGNVVVKSSSSKEFMIGSRGV